MKNNNKNVVETTTITVYLALDIAIHVGLHKVNKVTKIKCKATHSNHKG